LSTLVTNFLFFARPPAGKPIKFNLSKAIEEITSLFEKDSMHSAKLTIKRELQSDLWVVMDPTHLRQILWNLLLNAAEAIQNEGRIEVRTILQKNGNILIEIADTGCGIAGEVIHSIFDPFFTTKLEGTGLGLSIVHRILEAYDSRLDVHSEIGKGTVFSYSLRQVSPAII
jgi:two-component system sensor histidine kinase PilS (NtrC family)